MSNTQKTFMPRKSTVSKSTATAPKAPRKTRTRKTAATVKPPVAKTAPTKPVEQSAYGLNQTELKQVEKLVTEQPKATTVTTFKAGKVVSKELMRPTAPLIQLKDYRRDIINRWNIHNYEIQELLKDVKNTYNSVTTYFSKLEIQ
tara:strand:+ start:285 stop:719 length:435 start_codon:yes stop_codon:yes gene_type:complete